MAYSEITTQKISTKNSTSSKKQKQPILNRIAVIGNYLPRQCGIATFTTDLCQALHSEYKNTSYFVLPVTDKGEDYSYPSHVRFEIAEEDIQSYRTAAEFLNASEVDLVCLQHEYGIFGGEAGSYILTLLRELRMPVITTLHTVLRNPNPDQKNVLEALGTLSDRMIVMSEHSLDNLKSVYSVPKEKLDYIPHGIPDVAFMDPNYYKDLFGVEGKMVLLTFGLLSPNKGIENVIKALPAVVEAHPNLVYIVLGATHPHVRRENGESYRMSLVKLAEDLGVEKHVIFHNRFVKLENLVQYIGAADIYITPYLSPEQSVSGTLAYAVGAGKPVISTPYWYATELLADERGIIVPFGDTKAIAAQILELLNNEIKRHAIRKRAYESSRQMVWPKIAQQYMESFLKARADRAKYPRPVTNPKPMEQPSYEFPSLNLNHMKRMTDHTGILQHAIYTVPNYFEGYVTDDNARALIVAVALQSNANEKRLALDLATRYLAFLSYAYNPAEKRFRNFCDYDRHWLEETGSEDSHGRAVWALGTVLGRSLDEGIKGFSNRLFHLALPSLTEFSSPRAWAFAILGIEAYLREYPGDRTAAQSRKALAQRLRNLYLSNHKPEWPWFEDILAYCNALLPHAMLLCGESMQDQEFVDIGLNTLTWLGRIQLSEKGYFSPIGCHGFYPRTGKKARFDQQPIEVQAMISASLAAYRITKDESWKTQARQAFDWYLGYNDLELQVYDPVTGGCRDGLHPDRVNQNQGAESTLAFLHSFLEMQVVVSIDRSTKALHQLAKSL